MNGKVATVPAALTLALYSGLAFFEGIRLSAADTRTLLLSGCLLIAFAVGLAFRQLWAYCFGLLFLGLSAIGYLGLAVYLGSSAVSARNANGWEGIATFALFFAAAGLGLLSLVSFLVTSGLVIARRDIASGRSLGAWASSIGAAITGVCVVGFTVGHDYVHGRLPARHECAVGGGVACYSLAREERLPLAERREFARRGCEAAHDGACRLLAEFLTPNLGSESAEVRTLLAQCRSKNAGLCGTLGRHLLGAGEREEGISILEAACRTNVGACIQAAQAAERLGEHDVSEALLTRGCGLDDAFSCRELLRQVGPSMNPEERGRLGLRVCLLGDVNDCRPLMRQSLTNVCSEICDGTTENRLHTCGYCAQEALKQDHPELARKWLTSNCQKGYRWSCEEFEKMFSARPVEPGS